jgi:hypothetical protein
MAPGKKGAERGKKSKKAANDKNPDKYRQRG